MSRTQAEWLAILEHSFEYEKNLGDGTPATRLAYLSMNIFDFHTDDGEKDEEFAQRAVEACLAISNRTTFEYIKDEARYRWFLIMLHMPFFVDRTECGCSVRGSWWCGYNGITFRSCGIWDGDVQLHEPMKFDEKGWQSFVDAVCEFATAGDQGVMERRP